MNVGILWVTALFIYKLRDNLGKWDRDNYSDPVNHGKQWRNTALGMIPAGILLWHPLAMHISISHHYWFLQGLLTMILTAAVMLIWFWFFFDGLYNLFRRFPFFMVGRTDTPEHKMSKSDKFLKKLLPRQVILIKTLPLVLLTTLYILIIVL